VAALDDEFTEDASQFKERHYREFVSFLPYVQRFPLRRRTFAP
jgi:hypothetical protein